MAKPMLLVFDNSPPEMIADIARRVQKRENSLFIVCQPRAVKAWKERGFQADASGHGWLPLNLIDLDATSYLLKRNIRIVVMNEFRTELEKVFKSGAEFRRIPVSTLEEYHKADEEKFINKLFKSATE